MGARLITVYWRDIPAQVIVKKGRHTGAKVQLAERFQVAIDRAAMRAGKASSEHYLADWRRESQPCAATTDAELSKAAEAAAAALEAAFPPELLERVTKNGGLLPASGGR